MAQLYEVSQVAHPNDLSLPLQSEAWKGYVEGTQPGLGSKSLLGRERGKLFTARAHSWGLAQILASS